MKIAALFLLTVAFSTGQAIGADKPQKMPDAAMPFAGTSPSKKLNARMDKVRNLPTIPVVETKTYFTDYQANEVSADTKYKSKPFILVGKVSEISKNAFGSVYLAFHGDKYGFKSIHAELFQEQVCGTVKDGVIQNATTCPVEQKAAELKKGQKISLDCFGSGMIMKIPMANECLVRL